MIGFIFSDRNNVGFLYIKTSPNDRRYLANVFLSFLLFLFFGTESQSPGVECSGTQLTIALTSLA